MAVTPGELEAMSGGVLSKKTDAARRAGNGATETAHPQGSFELARLPATESPQRAALSALPVEMRRKYSDLGLELQRRLWRTRYVFRDVADLTVSISWLSRSAFPQFQKSRDLRFAPVLASAPDSCW